MTAPTPYPELNDVLRAFVDDVRSVLLAVHALRPKEIEQQHFPAQAGELERGVINQRNANFRRVA